MIRKGIWAKGPFSPGTSGPFPLHPLTCSWPINEVTFGMNRGVSPPLHRTPWHISLYIKHFHKLMGWCIHTHTHTRLFSRTPPHAEAYWHSSSSLLSLSVPAGWVQHISLLRFGSQLGLPFVCRPAGNGVRMPCSHPHTSRHLLPKKLVSIMISPMR